MANNDVSVEDEQHLLLRIEQFVEDFGNSESRQQGLDEYDKIIKYLNWREHEAELRGRIDELQIRVERTKKQLQYTAPNSGFGRQLKYDLKEIQNRIKELTAPTTNDTATDGENNI